MLPASESNVTRAGAGLHSAGISPRPGQCSREALQCSGQVRQPGADRPARLAKRSTWALHGLGRAAVVAEVDREEAAPAAAGRGWGGLRVGVGVQVQLGQAALGCAEGPGALGSEEGLAAAEQGYEAHPAPQIQFSICVGPVLGACTGRVAAGLVVARQAAS